jgi:hypothetical protein
LPQSRLVRIYIPAPVLALACILGGLPVSAQDKAVPTVEGYITVVRSFNDFDVNGTRVSTSPATHYGIIGGKSLSEDGGLHGALTVGAYVQIIGDVAGNSVEAREVLFAGDWNKKAEGFGVIDRVISSGSEPVFQADGYRIRIASATVTKFAGGLKGLAEVGPNTWVKYEGKRDKAGLLVATKITFVPARRGKVKPPPHPAALPGEESLIDADGNFLPLRTKVRMGDAGGECGWHRLPADPALQARVWRVGTSVVPAYQKQLGDDSPSKIHFRFYAVDEANIRSELGCNPGLVLVPKQVVERLRNDDQLAAVMADGVAYNLQSQFRRLTAEDWEILGAEVAGEVALANVPGGSFLGGEVGAGIASHVIEMEMQEQRGRIALTLMADAGYDPKQAPEAWRLLAPKKMPSDPRFLKYPSRAGYQLSFLRLEGEPPQPGQAAP